MMKYEIGDIKREVRITLDENSVSVPLVIEMDNDTLSLDELIESKVIDAVKSVTQSAPSHLLDGGVEFARCVEWEKGLVGKGMRFTALPEDFMRLVVFQMSDWRRPVLDVISDADPRYFMQKSKFSGIRGGVEKPVCAITTYPDGRMMEFYSCAGGSNVSVRIAKYIPYPIITDGKIEICKKLYSSVVYYIAGLVAATLKDKEQSALLFSFAKDLLK